jgi:filamentous hemagglutinin family protein
MAARHISTASAIAIAVASLSPRPARAQEVPTNGTVAAGSATIGAPSGGHLTIDQSSARAVLNWNSFGVGSGGTVTFNQPDSQSATLNRVTGNAPSSIDGRVESNGAVYLVNPNGIAIGSGGVVDTRGGFVASTLDITDGNFMAGTLNFAGSNANGVSNAGSISSDAYVALLGGHVSNSGTITVSLGRVALGAATSATLDLSGDGFLQVALPTDATDVNGTPLVDNSGHITADRGRIELKASVAADAVRQAVNMSGSLQAKTVSGTNGNIVLSANGAGSVTVSGGITASGAVGGAPQAGGSISMAAGGALTLSSSVTAIGGVSKSGGRIDITGDTVTLTGATVDVSGGAAGGLIRIGGAYKGGLADDGSSDWHTFVGRYGTLPAIATARTVSIDSAAHLHADGTDNFFTFGNSSFATGGTLIVTSSQDTAIRTTDWRAGGIDGAVGVSSFGLISALSFPDHRSPINGNNCDPGDGSCNLYDSRYFGPDLAEHLFFGAKTLIVADPNYDAGGAPVMDVGGLQSTIENARTFSIEASDSLRIVNGLMPIDGGLLQPTSPHDSGNASIGTLTSMTLRSGRLLSIVGGIDSIGAGLTIIDNDPMANGNQASARGAGAALLDLTGADFDSHVTVSGPNFQGSTDVGRHRDIAISLLAGNDGGAGGRIRLGTIDATVADRFSSPRFINLSIAAAQGGAIEFNGNVSTDRGNAGDPNDGPAEPEGTLNLTGSLVFAADSLVAGAALNWNDFGGTATISGFANGHANFSANYELATVSYDGAIEINPLFQGIVTDTSLLLPTLSGVTSGSASVNASQTNQVTITQTSDRAVIDWSSFSIGSSSTVNFIQPSATSATLNRVAANGSLSQLDGTLHSNGQIFLVNPNGIAISGSGVIDTRGGFVASSLGIGNTPFMAGTLAFSGRQSGAISNAGSILTDPGGLVALFGATITNQGGITADGGKIVLGAGGGFTLTPAGAVLATLTDVSAFGGQNGALVTQTGTISASGGKIAVLAATNNSNLHQTIDLGGTLTTAKSGGFGGAISLYSNDSLSLTGSLLVTGTTGGRIDATARGVTVIGATIDASGTTGGGGLIRLGGAYRDNAASDGSAAFQIFAGRFGSLPSLAVADSVAIDSSTTINATGGTGGTLIVASKQDSAVNGLWHVGATGATAISSFGTVSVLPTLASDANVTGTLMLGAKTVEIGATPSAVTGTTTFDLAAMASALGTLRSVSIEAADTLALPAGLDLTGSGIAGLTLRAVRGIGVTGSLNGGGASVSLIANDGGADAAPSSSRGNGASYIDLTGGTVATYGVVPGSLAFSILAGSDNGVGGQIRLSPMDSAGGVARFANLDLSAAGQAQILFNGDVTTAAGTLTLNGNLAFAADTTIFSASLNWVTAGSSGVFGSGGGNAVFRAKVALIDNGTLRYRGLLGDGQAASIALDGLDVARSASITYGVADTDLADAALRIVSGSLRPGGTLGAALSPGIVSVSSGHSGRLNVGSYGLGLMVGTRLADASDTLGYFFALTAPVSNAVAITQRAIGFSGNSVGSTYGTAATLTSSISGVLSGDDVAAPVVVKDGNGAVISYAARTSAGSYTLGLGTLSGAQAGNYVFNPAATAALTIGAKSVTYAGGDITSTYGTLATFNTGLSGVLSGDNIAASLKVISGGVTLNYADRSNAGSYTIALDTLSGISAANYTIDPAVTGILTVSPRTVSYAGGNVATTYGDLATLNASLSGVLTGDGVTSSVVVSDGHGAIIYADRTNAGSYTLGLGALAGGQATNYVVDAAVTGTLTIGKRLLTYGGGDVTATYGTAATLSANPNGILSGEDVSGTVSVAVAGSTISYDAHTHAGGYTLGIGALNGAQAANYAIDSSVSGSLTIDPLAISLSNGVITRPYGDSRLQSGGITLNQNGGSFTGALSGDDVQGVFAVSGSLNGQGRLPSASYSLGLLSGSQALTGANASDYVLDRTSSTSGTLFVTQRAVTYTIGTGTRVYGSATTPTITLSGALTGDDIIDYVLAQPGGGGVNALDSRTKVGSYSLTLGGLFGNDGGNYILAGSGNTPGLLSTTPKPIDFNLGFLSQTYGSTSSNFATSFFAGDDVSAAISVANGSGAVSIDSRVSAGSYSATLIALTGADASNYSIATAAANGETLTVHTRQISASIAQQFSTYGSVATPSATPNGVLSGDSVTVSVAASQGGNGVTLATRTGVGDYTLTTTGLGGASASNYSLSGSASGTLTIQQRSLDYVLTNLNAIYGAPAPTASFGGVVSGDSVSATIGATLNHIGVTLDQHAQVGNYIVFATGLSGTDAANYQLGNGSSATLVISPRPLTYSGGNSGWEFGSFSNNLAGASFTGVIAGDQVSAFMGASVGGATITPDRFTHAGSYAIVPTSLTGAQAANYSVASSGNTPGTLTITPRPVTFQASGLGATYGSPITLSGSVIGAITSDFIATPELLSNGQNIAYAANTPVGSYNFGNVTLTGAGANDYVFTSASGNLTILRKTLLSLGQTYTYSYGDLGSSGVNIVTNGNENFRSDAAPLTGDDVHIAFAGTPTLSSTGWVAPGQYLLGFVGLTGAAAGNYQFNTAGNAQIVVNPRALNYTISSTSRTYGSSILPTVTVDAPLAGDSVDYELLDQASNAALADRASVGVHMLFVHKLFGQNAGYYTLAGSPTAFTIDPLALTVNTGFFARSQTYGSFSLSDPLSGILSGDSVGGTFSLGAGTLAPTTDVGSYTATLTGLSGASAGNYVIASGVTAPQSLTITQRPVGFNAASYAQTYGVTPDATSFTSLLSGFLGTDGVAPVISSSQLGLSGATRANAGSYTIQLGLSGAKAGDYSLAQSSLAYTITPYTLRAMLNGTSVYGDALPAFALVDAPLSGDTIGLGVSSSAALTGRVAAGSYAISGTATGAAGANYVITPASGNTLTVTQRPITYTIAAQSWIYTDTAPVPAVQLNGIFSGDDVSGVGTALSQFRYDVGSYTSSLARLTGAQAGDYKVATSGNSNGIVTIVARPLTLVSAVTVTYGDNFLTGATGTHGSENLSFFKLSSEDAAVLARNGTVGLTLTSADASGTAITQAANVGTYSFTATTDSSRNYQGLADYVIASSTTPSTLTVLPRTVTYSVDSESYSYNGGGSLFDGYDTARSAAVYINNYVFARAGFDNNFAQSFTGGANIQLTADASGTALASRPTPGSYYAKLAAVQPASADFINSNYIFVNVGAAPVISITPLQIRFLQSVNISYGDQPTFDLSHVLYVVPGDRITLTAILPNGTDASKLDRGNYSYNAVTLSGPDAAYYTLGPLDPSLDHGVNIDRRSLSVSFHNIVYGDGGTVATIDDGLVNGDKINIVFNLAGTPTSNLFNNTLGLGFGVNKTQVRPGMEVGTYDVLAAGLGDKGYDYSINFSGDGYYAASFTITPRPITANPIAGATGRYGDSQTGIAFGNFMAFDTSSVEPLLASGSQAFLTFADNNTVFGATGKLAAEVGTYTYSITGLTGGRSGNYVLTNPNALSGSYTVTPRPLTFTYDLDNRSYGIQSLICVTATDCYSQPDTKPVVNLGPTVKGGPLVDVAFSLKAANGSSQAYTTATSVGTYTIVPTALTGPGAADYFIDTTQQRNSSLTINPAVVGYKIDPGDGHYVQQVGFLGAPAGGFTLNGVANKEPVTLVTGIFSGADTNAVNTMFVTSLETAAVGDYHFQGIGLIGPANGNYVLGTVGGTWGQGAYFTVNNLQTLTPLLGITPPTASILAVTSDKAGSTSTQTTSSTNGANSTLGSSKTLSQGASNNILDVPQGLFDDTTGTSARASASTSAIGAGAAAGAGANVSGTLTAGDVSVTGEASLNAGATVSVGITGIKLQAGASAAASVTLQDGIVYTTIGVQAGASGEAALKLISLSPSIYGAAQAGIQAQIATGVSGSLGQGVSGSAQIEAAAFVLASAKDGFKVKDGNIQVIADNFTGNGASIGVAGNLDTGPVGVNAGVTAYSPGVLGEKFDPTIGLDGDKVNIGADLGLAIGPFGVGIKFNVTLNAGDVASYFANVGSGLAEAFGGLFSSSCDGTCTRARNDATAVEKLTALNPITDAQTILTTLQNGDFYIPTLVTPDGTRWGQERNRPPIVQQYEAVAQNWVKAQSDFAAASKQQTELVTQMVKDPTSFTPVQYNQLLTLKAQTDTDMKNLNTALAGLKLRASISSSGQVEFDAPPPPAPPTPIAQVVSGAIASVQLGGH